MTMPRRTELHRRTLFHSHRQASCSKELLPLPKAKGDFAEMFLPPSDFFLAKFRQTQYAYVWFQWYWRKVEGGSPVRLSVLPEANPPYAHECHSCSRTAALAIATCSRRRRAWRIAISVRDLDKGGDGSLPEESPPTLLMPRTNSAKPAG